jgi:hypothetical protein
MKAAWIALGVLLLCTACTDNENRGDGVTGPGIDVHCLDQLRQLNGNSNTSRPGIGDTTVRVTCPGSA